MSNLTKRLEAVEVALAKKCGDADFKVIIREDDETSDQAIARAGLTQTWPGQVLCISFIDAKL